MSNQIRKDESSFLFFFCLKINRTLFNSKFEDPTFFLLNNYNYSICSDPFKRSLKDILKFHNFSASSVQYEFRVFLLCLVKCYEYFKLEYL